MPALDIFGNFMDPYSQDQGASKLVNCRVVVRKPEEGKIARVRLVGSPGLKQVCKPTASPCIVLCHAFARVWSGHADGTIYSGVETANPVYEGAVTVDPVMPIIRMAEDRTALAIASNGTAGGGHGSAYTATPGGGVIFANLQGTINFDPTSVCVLDNYTIWAGASDTYANQSDKMYSSSPLAPATVNANSFAVAEARADDVSDVVTIGRTFWPMGKRTIEMWYDQGGSSDFAFTPFTNSLIEVGMATRRSLATLHSIVMWIGTDRRVWLGKGQSGQAISPSWVDLLLQQDNIEEITSFMYAQGGDEFYVMTCEKEWSVELALSTMVWTYRKSPGREDFAGRCAVEHDGGHSYIGLDSGEICLLDLSIATEPAGVMERSIVTMWLGIQEQRHAINKIDVTSYMGPEAGTFTLDWSEDRMETWKGLRTIAWPKPGERRAIARAMGTSRRRQVRLNYHGLKAPFVMDEFFVEVSEGS